MTPAIKPITDAALMQLSSQNPELRFERNADGTLSTMPPTGKISSNRELKAGAYLFAFVDSNELGEVFSSSGGGLYFLTVHYALLMLLLLPENVYQKDGILEKTNFAI